MVVLTSEFVRLLEQRHSMIPRCHELFNTSRLAPLVGRLVIPMCMTVLLRRHKEARTERETGCRPLRLRNEVAIWSGIGIGVYEEVLIIVTGDWLNVEVRARAEEPELVIELPQEVVDGSVHGLGSFEVDELEVVAEAV